MIRFMQEKEKENRHEKELLQKPVLLPDAALPDMLCDRMLQQVLLWLNVLSIEGLYVRELSGWPPDFFIHFLVFWRVSRPNIHIIKKKAGNENGRLL